ncbi:hypothetical protein CC86DRAFT_448877 [Ophiobolus disseminans]|uniref:Uncharacterized protein n=1 Tax=Ophiobolus disseminans TaxID=1469910 RepID=A0A6A6ZK55_9PLEO|nr:hypothetical protein CC86DRAFT_448877 [Ophiobolus disseminans]
MKYILIASLLSCAVYAAPFAQVQGGNVNGQTTQQQGQQQQQGSQQQQGTQGAQAVQGVQGAQGVNQPATGPQTGTGAGIANGQTPTPADLATAVSNWQADTSMVSNFLNTGASIQNNVQFKQAATVAFNAEVDELNHKAIIDAATGTDPNVIAANSTLATGGSFQDVVDKLQQMSVQGMAAVANIDLINQNRCVNVLPNIDAYMASTGSASQAIRPTVCDQTGVAGGVQGTGATQPGAPAGSPAAAFAAAQALAAGTGNGLVQNGAAGAVATPPQAAAPQQGQQQAGVAQGQTPAQAQAGAQGQIQDGAQVQTPAQQGIAPSGVQPQGVAAPSAGVQTPQQGQQIQNGQQIAQQGQQTPQQAQQAGQQIQNPQSPAAAANSALPSSPAGTAAQGQTGNGRQNAGAATQQGQTGNGRQNAGAAAQQQTGSARQNAGGN